MRTVMAVAILGAVMILSGCDTLEKPVEIRLTEAPKPAEPTASKQRFDNTSESVDASQIYTTRVLSEENEKLREQIEMLMEEKKLLGEDKQTLSDRVDMLKESLAQTEKELTEANELLVDMRVELDKWKENVLGYREELRTVHTEQLRALAKILKLMGAEMVSVEQSGEVQ